MGTTRNRQILNCNRPLQARRFLSFLLSGGLALTLGTASLYGQGTQGTERTKGTEETQGTPGSLADQSTWHLLIEPQFMHPPAFFPIPGAKRTVFVPGYLKEGEPVYFTRAEYEKIHLTLDQFLQKSRANSSDKKVTARFVRNTTNQTIEYAVLQSESPLMATAVLAPDFIEKFKSLLGEKLIVAVPNRNTVFVFPTNATVDYHSYSGPVLEAYKESANPVSTEAFELSKDGLQAIGSFEE